MAAPDRTTLLAVHAHPDDEVIGTGGILARYSAAGVRVALVCATRGEVGEIVDPTMNTVESRARLAEIREGELLCACGVLGVHDLRFLGYWDSGMAGTPENQHPDAFCRADVVQASARLVSIIRALRPQVVVTYDAKGGYGHPDHIMAHRVTVRAFDLAGDPGYRTGRFAPWAPSKLYFAAIPRSAVERMHQQLLSAGQPSPFDRSDLSPESFGTPDDEITTLIDVRAHLERKRDALLCHRTQFAADSFFFTMPEELVAEVFGYEHFVRARSLVDAPPTENDLFAGLSSTPL